MASDNVMEEKKSIFPQDFASKSASHISSRYSINVKVMKRK